MEVLVAFILIIVLLFCTGTPVSTIAAVILGALGLITAAIFAFFVYCDILLLGSKKKTAVFSRIGKNPRMKIDCAYYLVDSEEYANAFPCEIALRKKLYVPEKQVTVRLIPKKKMVFDTNAFMSSIFGTAVFAVLLVMTANGLLNFFT